MSRRASRARLIGELLLVALAVGAVVAAVRDRRHRDPATDAGSEKAIARSEVEERAEQLAREVDQLRNSDRHAFERLQELIAQDDLYAVQALYEEFLQKYPVSAYRRQVEADLGKLNELIAEEEKRIETALAAAEAAASPLEAFEILAAADEGPVSDQRITDAMEKYRAAADRLRAGEEARRHLGIVIEDLRSAWELRKSFGEGLWLPSLKLDVRNITDAPITDLRISAQFVDEANKRLLGNRVTDYVASRFGGTPTLPAGMAKPVFLYGEVGFTSDWVFVGEGPKVAVEISVSRDNGEFVPLKTVPVEKPAAYRGLGP